MMSRKKIKIMNSLIQDIQLKMKKNYSHKLKVSSNQILYEICSLNSILWPNLRWLRVIQLSKQKYFQLRNKTCENLRKLSKAKIKNQIWFKIRSWWKNKINKTFDMKRKDYCMKLSPKSSKLNLRKHNFPRPNCFLKLNKLT